MLSASQTPSRLIALRGYKIIVFLTAMLMSYTLLVGWMLIFGLIPFQSAYLLIAIGCVAPIVAYLYGFLQPARGEKDWGLLLSAIGWFAVMIALLIQHSGFMFQVLETANQPGAILRGGLETGALLFSIVAVAFLAAGAVLSLTVWSSERSALRNAFHDEELRRNARRGP